MESKYGSLKGMAEGQDRLPTSRRGYEGTVVNRLDEQLHETCSSVIPYSLSAS